MRLQKLTTDDRPREKLKVKGPAVLSDFELLQALIGSGNKHTDVTSIAKNTKRLFEENGAEITYEQLEKVAGLGPAKITELLAALELSKRYLIESEQPIINSPDKAIEQLEDIRNKKQEYFICLTLDGANRLIAKRTITIGTLSSSLVHPREVFADAIADRAAGILVAHNHPSNTPLPSDADIVITNRLQNAGEIAGITLYDHIIVTKNSHFSLVENNLLHKSK